ncbi:hypothetical protein [Streptomyces sp. NPDC020141]|uniref:hypothetical protein n=1 Tax=Streptomyces sp. NPDC020141 TaxID=3365065 RepID=UPI003798323D
MAMASWRKVMTAGATVIGALSLSVSPASAAPNWQPWVQPQDYQCGTTTLHYHSVNIAHQTCIIRNPATNTYQAVNIVVNNHTEAVYLRAFVYKPGRNGYDECTKTKIPAKTRVACYGDTAPATSAPISSHSSTFLNDAIADDTTTVTYN